MSRITRIFLFAFLLMFSKGIIGQEMYGLVFSEYSSLFRSQINPAYLSNSKVFVDINLFSLDVQAQNNMYYFPSFPSLVNEFFRTGTINIDGGPFLYDRIFNYYANENTKYISSNVSMMGPSAMIQMGRHAFGLTTSANSVSSGNHIPYEMPIFFYEGIEYEPYQGIEFNNYDYSYTALAWFETALSYAYNFYDRYHHKFTIGFTGKFLMGYGGGYSEIRNADFIVHDAETIEFINFDADMGYALPVDYQTGDYVGSPAIKGFGGAMDLGFVYTYKESSISSSGEDRLCARPYEGYLFRLGVSLLDFGYINFNKNTELQGFDNVNAYWEQFDTVSFNSIEQTMQNWSKVFYGNPDFSYKGDKIRMGLPAAVSVQFDYSFKKSFYVSGLWMHPFRFNLTTVWRPAQLAIIGRYETKIFGVSLPVSVFDYQQFRVGLAVRIYGVTIGSDSLAALVGASDLTGMDLYFSFRFSLDKGLCLSRNRGACD